MNVELVDQMGTDLTVVNAARVSFDKESEWIDVQTDYNGGACPGMGKGLVDKDQRLIYYLAKHEHFTPFTHVMITMRETVPIFVARQRFKHVIGFSYNEISRRYVDDSPDFFFPEVWREKADNKKQGSGDGTIQEAFFHNYAEGYTADIGFTYSAYIESAKLFYQSLIDAGVAPEQARMVLPQSMMTSYYVTGSLAAWARAYKLRSSPDAQAEIQDLAAMWENTIGTIDELKYSWLALTN